MKHFFLFLIFIATVGSIYANDLLILRDGTESIVKITEINNSEITYKDINLKNSPEIKIAASNVYMFKIDMCNNIYVNPDGSRRSGENSKFNNKSNVIYLVKGEEIPAIDITMADEKIIYTMKGKNKYLAAFEIPTSQVFFIRHKNGIREIITPLKDNQRDSQIETKTQDNSKEKVEFYTIKKGDTITTIASKYGVSTTDLREWNDISTTIKDSTQLKVGEQFIIYIKEQ